MGHARAERAPDETTTHERTYGASPLAEPVALRLRAALAVLGERRLGAQTGLPRATVARALAGLPVRRGTALTIHAALALLDDEGTDTLRKAAPR